MRAPDFWRRDGIVPAILSPISGSGLENEFAYWEGRPVPGRCSGHLYRKRRRRWCRKNACRTIGDGELRYTGKMPVSSAGGTAAKSKHQHWLKSIGIRLGKSGMNHSCLRKVPRLGSAPTALPLPKPPPNPIEVLVMDDGLQNPALHKDLSILVVDGQYGFGNNRVMPAGPLREPVEEVIKRVQAIAVIGTVSDPLATHMPNDLPILAARFVPAADDDISGRPVVAFAGIGRPEKFFETLAGMGCDLVDAIPFPDHHISLPMRLCNLSIRPPQPARS